MRLPTTGFPQAAGRGAGALRFAIALVLVGLLVPVPAAWARVKVARFNATVNGTFTSTGKTTRTYCDYYDDLGVYHQFTKHETVKERTVFSSRGSGIVEIKSLYRPLYAEMVKRIPGRATINRSLASDQARPCTEPADPTFCGQRTMSLQFAVVEGRRRSALGYSNRSRSGSVPHDPFESADSLSGSDCPGVEGQLLWTKLLPPPTAVSKAKLFRKRVKRIVVRGVSNTTEPLQGSPEYSSQSSSHLSYTIVLKRRRH